MGRGASQVEARVAASFGVLEAVAPDFQPALDVSNGGVLFALPALLAMGLLQASERYFTLPKGYYGLDSLWLLLAFMALARLPSIESLRYCAPGEWGKLLGLDRVPEVRTLRRKVRLLARDEKPGEWSAELCRQWMEAAPEQAATLYIDGHVRIYHGRQTKLPRHYVARQRLCLSATTDYWVNAMDGQPFLVVHQTIDPGLIKVIEQEILPCLNEIVPGQPGAEDLQADPLRHRFTLVFDREGYSPDLLRRMKKQRAACLTYHAGKLSRLLAQFGAMTLEQPIEPQGNTPPHHRRRTVRRGPLSSDADPEQAPDRYDQDGRLPSRDGHGQQPTRNPRSSGRGPPSVAGVVRHRNRSPARPGSRNLDGSPPSLGQCLVRRRNPKTLPGARCHRNRVPRNQSPLGLESGTEKYPAARPNELEYAP